MSHHPIRAARRLVAAVILGLIALIAPMALASSASAAPPSTSGPTSITAVAATDPALAAQLPNVPGSVPQILAAVGTPFQVTVTLFNGSTPATYNTDTAVTLTSSGGTGSLSTTTATIPAGQSSVTISTSYSAATNGLVVTATTTNKKSVLTASTVSFPVNLSLNLLPGNSPLLPNGTAGADGNGCAVVDAAHPMCAIVQLPSGATGNVVFSIGVCPAKASCIAGGLVNQVIADMPAATRTSPARLTIVCDKTLCGSGGVNKYLAMWSQDATSPLAAAPACPSKGIIGPDQTFCTDYVSSTRGNSADLSLVVLFLKDLRGSIK
ncbi:hypothetical protein LK09_01115 [Microbacterium mangrovi]|uniref:Ig-like domain-containing protein n=1 Tax=Microbacterium mangrovi TaxID=1348253 RepID=A0A0B2AE04_9MICO|nr:hypothetical protein [Microbacterium mangrovi]KHK99950.1 hypothetical protein LK09_01115 [Microbacterium mangrovi]